MCTDETKVSIGLNYRYEALRVQKPHGNRHIMKRVSVSDRIYNYCFNL